VRTLKISSANAVSVVIPTLGGEVLRATIDGLRRSSTPPAEILICIPSEFEERVRYINFPEVKILQTTFRGQVPQRIWGFNHAVHQVVMQLDDDIIVDEFCIERLLVTLRELGPSVAVGPALVDKATGHSVYRRPLQAGVLSTLYYWMMNGSAGHVPGGIDKSGSSVGVDTSTASGVRFDVEWLAGGCVMHYKDNLVLENFWPLPGKAYYEDVVHSCILSGRGVRLVVDASAHCTLESFRESSMTLRDFFQNLYRDYQGRRYFMRRFSRQSPRIYIYYLIRALSYLYKRRWIS
jgi:glycosyltransferase involved in cell wall biosynthesis